MQRVPRICGCGLKIAPEAQCPCERKRVADRRAAHDATRPSAAARGYDAAWRRNRGQFLARHPMCSHPGCKERATEVDHIVSVRERPDLRLTWSNLRGLCKSHHSSRTAREQGFAQPKTSTVSAATGKRPRQNWTQALLDAVTGRPREGGPKTLADPPGTDRPSLTRDTPAFSLAGEQKNGGRAC